MEANSVEIAILNQQDKIPVSEAMRDMIRKWLRSAGGLWGARERRR